MAIIASRYSDQSDAAALLSPLNKQEFNDSASNHEVAEWFRLTDPGLFDQGSLDINDLADMVDVARKNLRAPVRIDCGPGNSRWLVIYTT